MTYAEKLRNPRWQKKRLHIFERDGWACRKCCSTTRTLHVHHNYYIPCTDPWDYVDSALFTVCDDCHKCEEDWKQIVNETVVLSLRVGGALNSDIQAIACLIQEITENGNDASGIPMIRFLLEEFSSKRKEQRK